MKRNKQEQIGGGEQEGWKLDGKRVLLCKAICQSQTCHWTCLCPEWLMSLITGVRACTFGCHICVCTGMFAHHCYNIVCVCVGGGGGEWICIQHLTPELPREIYYLYFSNYGTDPEKYTKFETCNSNSLTAPIPKYKHTDWAIINHLIHWFLIKNYITVYEIFIQINI